MFLQLQCGVRHLDHVVANLVRAFHRAHAFEREVLHWRSPDLSESAYIATCHDAIELIRLVHHEVAGVDAGCPVVQHDLEARGLPHHALDGSDHNDHLRLCRTIELEVLARLAPLLKSNLHSTDRDWQARLLDLLPGFLGGALWSKISWPCIHDEALARLRTEHCT